MKKQKHWITKTNAPMILIFYVLIFAFILTYLVPAGEFNQEVINGVKQVIPGTYHNIEQTHLSLFVLFESIPVGMQVAAPYLFIVFIAGALFNILSSTKSIDNAIITVVKKIGLKRRTLLIILSVYIYGFFGITIGFENNIALIPIGVIISSALGLSNMIGVCIAAGGVCVGFALSPINPYTVGVAQQLAGLPLFSGAILRTFLVVIMLTILGFYIAKILVKLDQKEQHLIPEKLLEKSMDEYKISKKDILVLLIFFSGVSTIAICSLTIKGFYINQISAVFIIIAILVAIVFNYSPNEFARLSREGMSKVAPGALIIGIAASIKVILQDGHIVDSIVYYLGDSFTGLPIALTAVIMSIIQSIINLFIPGGSGQALATMPILLPLAEIIGMSKQVMILAFQIGDGLGNMIVPTSGGTLAMLAMGGLEYSRWVKVIIPFLLIAYAISWVFLIIATFIGY